MSDQNLDELLRRARPSLSSDADDAARNLVMRTRPGPGAARPRVSRPMRVGIVVGCALGLTGAASLAAYELSIPPFQTIPDSVQRVSTGIPVNYEETDGSSARCLAFLEFADLSSDQLGRVYSYVRGTDWQGYGEGLASQIAVDDPQPKEHAVMDLVWQDLRARVGRLLPDIALTSSGEAIETDTPRFYGVATSCTDSDDASN